MRSFGWCALILLVCGLTTELVSGYDVTVKSILNVPLISSKATSPMTASSTYQQVFNPSWVEPSSGSGNEGGLLIRTQNCSTDGSTCRSCGSKTTDSPSIITFSPAKAQSGTSVPSMGDVTAASVVFGPGNKTFDNLGTEDPRIKLDPATGTYYMFYTSYGTGDGKSRTVLLSLATTKDPTKATGWTRHGAVFPSYQGSKSAALLVRESGPHYLLWGDSEIRITNSTSLTSWPSIGDVLLAPRPSMFDSKLVEAGPPPMKLSDGNLLFLHNSANDKLAYHVSWAILDGSNPSKILARASSPLLSPDLAWEEGVAPWSCNVGNVVFLEAAHPVEGSPDTFRVFFGAADARIGTAVVSVSL